MRIANISRISLFAGLVGTTAFLLLPGLAAADEELNAGRQEIVKLNRELIRAKLDRIAIVVDRASDGGSTLLIGKGVGANPRVGHVSRDIYWGDTPFITVYPVSSPVPTKLEGVGEGKILGAVSLLVSAVAPDGKERAEPGVYLLFQKTLGRDASFEVSANYTSLVSMSVDGEGRVTYKEGLALPLLGHDPEEGSPTPEVTVEFPDKASVSKENPAWRAKVGMKWMEDLYRFRLDVEVTME